MRLSGKHKSRRGFSLIELMVSLVITMVVMTGAFQIFTEGMAFFRVNNAAADAQASITKAMGLIAAEVANAAPMVTQVYPAAGSALPGITFATPLQEGGAVRYDPVNGTIFWQRYICFYYEADPSGGVNGKIWRVTEDVDPTTEPLGGPGNRDTNYVADYLDPAITPVHNTNYFQSAAGTKRRLVSDGISGLDVNKYVGGYGATASEQLAFDLSIEAGDKNARTRDTYYLNVKSRVVPRG